MFFATSTRRLPTIAKHQNRKPLMRMGTLATARSAAAGSRIEQVLGACMMIGFFLVMALFG